MSWIAFNVFFLPIISFTRPHKFLFSIAFNYKMLHQYSLSAKVIIASTN